MELREVSIPINKSSVTRYAHVYAALEQAAESGRAISIVMSPAERIQLLQAVRQRYRLVRSPTWRVHSSMTGAGFFLWLERRDTSTHPEIARELVKVS